MSPKTGKVRRQNVLEYEGTWKKHSISYGKDVHSVIRNIVVTMLII
jgi:hypothetical protein